jgi:ABC-type Fe3+ transport system substrate-binding protein
MTANGFQNALVARASRILAAALGALAIACAPARAADPALVAAAEKEGEVVWYTSFVENQLARPMAEAFQKRYPAIKVRIVGGTAGDLLSRMLLEGRSGAMKADVSHGGSSVEPLKGAGLLDRYIPASAEAYPAEYRDKAGYWTAQNFYFLVAAVNTDLVKAGTEPKSYDDLLDPRWSGRIAWTNTMVQGGPLGFIGMIMTVRGPQAGEAYLRKLAGQRLVNVPANQRVVLDQVIAGEYPMALMVFNNHAAISMAKGAPVKWLKLDPVLGIADMTYLLKGAPHPNAARLFVDFVVSAEGQAVFRQAEYLPADPATPPLTASLRPSEGGFTARILLPDTYEAGAAQWRQLYDAIFK